jgi:hypothetical protein
MQATRIGNARRLGTVVRAIVVVSGLAYVFFLAVELRAVILRETPPTMDAPALRIELVPPGEQGGTLDAGQQVILMCHLMNTGRTELRLRIGGEFILDMVAPDDLKTTVYSGVYALPGEPISNAKEAADVVLQRGQTFSTRATFALRMCSERSSTPSWSDAASGEYRLWVTYRSAQRGNVDAPWVWCGTTSSNPIDIAVVQLRK